MVRKLVAFAVIIVLALAVTGCAKKEEPTKAPDVGQVGEDAAQKAVRASIDAMQTKWFEMRDKAAPATDEAKAELVQATDDMTALLDDAKAKLDEAKSASADDWANTIKPAIDKALADAQKLYDDTAAKFGQK